MPDHLTHKLLGAHLAAGELVPGQDITVGVDQVLVEDATGTMCAMQFELLGAGEVAVPLAVMYVDHNVLQIDDKNMQDHRYLRSFSRRYGMRFSPPGHGISHYIHLERFGRPGELLLGADSHTTMAGALGMFATGAGGLEVAVAMAGYGFDLPCPRVVGVELTGRLGPGSRPRTSSSSCCAATASAAGRGRCSSSSATAWPASPPPAGRPSATWSWRRAPPPGCSPRTPRPAAGWPPRAASSDFRPLAADPGAAYDEVERLDLSRLEPLVAVPPSPGDVVPVAEVAGTAVVQVCVGSSVNSSYEDLATVAAALRGRQVHPDIQLTVTPGSRQILDTIGRSGVYQDLLAAGRADAGADLRALHRHRPGPGGRPAVAAHLQPQLPRAQRHRRGRRLPVLTVDRGRERPDRRDHRPADRGLAGPAPGRAARHHPARAPDHRRAPRARAAPGRGRAGRQPGPAAAARATPDDLDGRVLIVVGDDISTGDMAPDGVIAMSVWSNIAECARFMFRRLDPEFHDRARSWGGGLIVGGDNYGQGSSREHAALAPCTSGSPRSSPAATPGSTGAT